MFKSLHARHHQNATAAVPAAPATPAIETDVASSAASSRTTSDGFKRCLASGVPIDAPYSTLSAAASLQSSNSSGGSTRVSSSDGGEEVRVRHSKAPEVPVLSINGKKLVDKLINQCKITSEFPLVELLKNTAAGCPESVDARDASAAVEEFLHRNELNAADKLKLAVGASAFANDDLGFDCSDVPEERVATPRLRSCMKTNRNHEHFRPAQLGKRVCFRTDFADGEDATANGTVATELHLYEWVRLKHRYAPTDAEKSALGINIDKADPFNFPCTAHVM